MKAAPVLEVAAGGLEDEFDELLGAQGGQPTAQVTSGCGLGRECAGRWSVEAEVDEADPHQMGAEEPFTPLGAVTVAVQRGTSAVVQDRLQPLAVAQSDRRAEAPFVLVRPVDLADITPGGLESLVAGLASRSATLNSGEWIIMVGIPVEEGWSREGLARATNPALSRRWSRPGRFGYCWRIPLHALRELPQPAISLAEVSQVTEEFDREVVLPGHLRVDQGADPLPRVSTLPCEGVQLLSADDRCCAFPSGAFAFLLLFGQSLPLLPVVLCGLQQLRNGPPSRGLTVKVGLPVQASQQLRAQQRIVTVDDSHQQRVLLCRRE